MLRTTIVHRRRGLIRAALGLLAASCALATHAGEVVVTLHDEYGQAIRDQQLVLHPPLSDPDDFWTAWRNGRRGNTDARGRLTFHDVPPGQYTAFLRRTNSLGLVPPQDNPLRPIPTVTLVAGQESVELEVELWRGIPVYLRVTLDDGDLKVVKALLRELDHSFTLEHRFGVAEDSARSLVPGRWSVRLDPPDGYLLQEIEVDGVSIAGDRALLDLRPLQPAVYVNWRLTSPALITGHVFIEGPWVPVEVVATLIAPGPWIGAALARGGSSYQIVRTGVAENGAYELELPDGHWEVRVLGDGVESSEPQQIVIQLPERGHERADFTISTGKDETSVLTVIVLAPNSKSVSGATVEVWPMDPAERGGQPIAREKTHGWGATLRDIPAGNLLVAAGHQQYIEGVRPIYDFDPSIERTTVTVSLQTAPRIQAVATDFDGEPVTGVRLELERLDADPDMLITDPELVEHVHHPVADTDATGHAWAEGLRPGTYRLHGRLPGSRGRFVRFVDGDDLVEQLDVTLEADQVRLVELVVLPSARLTGSLRCLAGRPLPSVVTVVAIPWSPEGVEGPIDQLMDQAVLFQDVSLGGDLRDTFLSGPLAQGDYFVAFKPRGFDRWSWALGGERHDEAAPIQAATGEPTDVGSLEIDCGPAIVVIPRASHGVPLPDLRDVPPGSVILSLSGQVDDGDAEHDVDDAVIDVFPNIVVARGLPDGEARLELQLSNGYFLPEPTRTTTVEALLERGHNVVVELPILGVGGMLRLNSDQGAAAKLSGEDDFERLLPLGSSGVLFRSVPAGTYAMELCGDPECTEILESWSGIEIRALETAEVKLARREP